MGVWQKIGGIWEKALILLLNITKFQDQRNKQEIVRIWRGMDIDTGFGSDNY